ncbi:MAG TPA: phosphotransferase [Candidatus Bathyarchaeia archaeon]|nr:phosphotransferase [Candidatus Bathyarchaeia archaeon]
MLKNANSFDPLRLFFHLVRTGRTLFRAHEGRWYSRSERYFLKVYDSHDAAERERLVLNAIKNMQPQTFDVPQTLNLVEKGEQSAILMEYVKGNELEPSTHSFLMFGTSETLNTFFHLGHALREFHDIIPITLHSNITTSKKSLVDSVKEMVNTLRDYGVLSPDDTSTILQVMKSVDICENVLRVVRLHGEAYFTHMRFSDNIFIFLDLEKSFEGPAYYDLATFLVSMYASVLVSKRSMQRLALLRNAFLRGYFGSDVPSASLRIAELSVILQEILKLHMSSKVDLSIRVRLLCRLKLRRFLWLLEAMLTSSDSRGLTKDVRLSS